MTKKIGILYDNISGNTGDVAIGLSVKKILIDLKVDFDELIPGNFNPNDYDTIIIGGGHLLRPSPDFFYDKFKIPGNYILNAMGIVGLPADLHYLDDYKYVTVRSSGDKKKISYLKKDIHVIPCTTMLLEDIKDFSLRPKKPSIGIHLFPNFFNKEDEELFIKWASELPYTIYFIPITHYNQDYIYLEKLSSKIKNSILLPILKPLEIFTFIGGLDYFISCSLHGAIFSYRHNVPFILLDQEKMRFFMEDRELQRYLFKNFSDIKTLFENLSKEHIDYSQKISTDLKVLLYHIEYLKNILPTNRHYAVDQTADIKKDNQNNFQIFYLQSQYISSYAKTKNLEISLQENNIKIKDLEISLQENNIKIKDLERDIQSKDQQISNKDGQISNITDELQSEYINIKDLERDIQSKDKQISNKDKQISNITDELQSKDKQISNITDELQSKDKQISNITDELQSKDKQISNLNNEIITLNNRLNGIESSISFKLVLSITSMIDKTFPDSTTHGKFRNIVVSSIRTIANEGIRSYLRHIGVKIKRREFKILDKGIVNIDDRNAQLQTWIAKNEPSVAKLKEYKKDIKNFKYMPKISIIIPVYNPDIDWIKAAIESVLKQVYDNWELCIADASTKKDVRKCIKDYAKKDSRIKVKFLTENKGIAGNSNEALSLATGEYIGLLDHDDELSPDALYEIVKHIQGKDADMIYSDEDKIDINGNRIDAFFKPDWSPDMFLSCMYTCHFGVYNKKIIDDIGGFRSGYDGSQDYDLVLRFIEKTNNIYHISKILYHWRMVPGSAAATTDAKNYAYVSAKKALMDYIKRNNIKGDVLDGIWAGTYRLKREISGSPFVSIIIPTKDKADILKRCIESVLKKTDYSNYEIIIVNNNSINKDTYDYFESLKEIDNIKILHYQKEFNFSAINNFAVKNAKGDIILFLNNDTEIISEGWMAAMLEHVQRNEVGCVGCKLLYPNDKIQHAGVIVGLGGVAGHSHKYFHKDDPGYIWRPHLIQNLSAVTAACVMIRKSVFEEIGGFDENMAVAFGDVDLCLKIREKGYLIVYTPYAELYHHESLSRGYEDTPEKQKRFLKEIKYLRKKWSNIIDKGDPYYNPNLTLDKEDFSIKI